MRARVTSRICSGVVNSHRCDQLDHLLGLLQPGFGGDATPSFVAKLLADRSVRLIQCIPFRFGIAQCLDLGFDEVGSCFTSFCGILHDDAVPKLGEVALVAVLEHLGVLPQPLHQVGHIVGWDHGFVSCLISSPSERICRTRELFCNTAIAFPH